MKSLFKTFVLIALAVVLAGCDIADISSEDFYSVNDVSSETSANVSEPTSSSISEDSSREVSSSIEHSSSEAFTTDDIDPVFKTEYSKNPLEVTEEDLKYLEIQAPILTEHLILSSLNLDNNFDKEEINQFFSLLTKYQDNTDYRYSPIMQESKDRIYFLFCFEDVNRTAHEIFGEQEWNFETQNMNVDKKHGVYAEEFGYGLYIPYFGTDFETTVSDASVEVEFTLYRRGEKDGDPHEFDEGRYIARYIIIKDEAGAFLRFDEFARP